MMKRNVIVLMLSILLIFIGISLALLIKANNQKEAAVVKTELQLNNEPTFPLYNNASLTVAVADPFVLKSSNGNYYLYGTTGGSGYKVYISSDLINWKEAGLAFASWKAKWAGGDFWAPEVVEKDNKYYMYYTARASTSKSLRIGVAVSDKPEGPFEDVSDKPLVDFGYAAIDANILKDDDGKYYMYFSRDCSENVVDGRNESHIYGIELNPDMISLKGEPVKLLEPDHDWEFLSGDWRWNEGSFSFKKNGLYYLMYSANYFDSRDYAVGYATSNAPLGEFVKARENPILTAYTYPEQKVSGTGHNNGIQTEDGMYTVYHRHSDPQKGSGTRQYSIDQMGVREDGTVFVNGPSIYKLPAPFVGNGLKNAALQAEISVSSTKAGYNPKGINDREIVFNNRNEKYEWVAADEDTAPSLSMRFGKPEKVNSIILYGSSLSSRRGLETTITINGTKIIRKVHLSQNPGEPTILSFEEMDVSEIKFEFTRLGENSEIGLSEIWAVSRR